MPAVTPPDYVCPRWDTASARGDWKNYVSEELRAMWHTFTVDQRAAMARNAEDLTHHEPDD